ncbi:hypothetical protein GCM10010488_08810 [Oerskovia jenensis]
MTSIELVRPPAPDDQDSERTPRATHGALALFGAVIATGLLLAGRLGGILGGEVAIGLVVALLVLAPTARSLSQRLAFNLCLVVGSVPALWMLPALEPVGRTTVALAVVTGTLTYWALSRPERARSLVPQVATVDLWPVVAGVVALAFSMPWFRTSTAAGALTQLQNGWDNAAHFNMFSMIRAYGVTTDRLGLTPDGETWKFSDYPQGFHTLAAAFAELVTPGEPGTISVELVTFTHAIGVVAAVAVVVMAAALCAMPAVRSRPWHALVGVFALLALMLFGPLGALPLNGFINFYLACALTGTVVMLAASCPRVLAPMPLAAICAALVGIAQGWILLLALAAPAVLLVLLPFRRERYRATLREKLASALILLAAFYCVARAALLLVSLSPTEVLTTNGGTPQPPVGLTVALLAGATAASLWGWSRARALGDVAPDDTPVLFTWIVPLCAGVSATGLALVLLSSAPTVTYYFWKYLFAVLVVGAVSLVVALVHLAPKTPAVPRTAAVAASVLASLALTQAFGLAVPRLPAYGFVTESPGWAARTLLAQLSATPHEASVRMADALASEAPEPESKPFFLVPPGETAQHPLSAAQWYLSLTNRWTAESNDALAPLLALDGSVDTYQAVTAEILAAAPQNVVLTDPGTAALLRSALPAADQDRIITWQ